MNKQADSVAKMLKGIDSERTAESIVRAVNSHKATVKALERLTANATECEMDEGPSMVDGITWDDILAARAALASAKEA